MLRPETLKKKKNEKKNFVLKFKQKKVLKSELFSPQYFAF